MTTLLINRDLLVASESCVIKRKEYLCYAEASDAIRLARLRIQREIEELESIREEAKRLGYEQGLEAGKAAATQEMAATMARLERANGGLEERIVATVMAALEHVLGALGDEALFEILARQAVRAAGAAKRLRLRVAPEQILRGRQFLLDMQAQDPQIDFVDIVPDETIASGGCVLESECGAIDGRIEAHLAAVRTGLMAAIEAEREVNMAAQANDLEDPVGDLL